jgi:hypothetical protein
MMETMTTATNTTHEEAAHALAAELLPHHAALLAQACAHDGPVPKSLVPALNRAKREARGMALEELGRTLERNLEETGDPNDPILVAQTRILKERLEAGEEA